MSKRKYYTHHKDCEGRKIMTGDRIMFRWHEYTSSYFPEECVRTGIILSQIGSLVFVWNDESGKQHTSRLSALRFNSETDWLKIG